MQVVCGGGMSEGLDYQVAVKKTLKKLDLSEVCQVLDYARYLAGSLSVQIQSERSPKRFFETPHHSNSSN